MAAAGWLPPSFCRPRTGALSPSIEENMVIAGSVLMARVKLEFIFFCCPHLYRIADRQTDIH